MRAAVVDAHGGLEALKLVERPTPTPRAHEATVDVKAAALNHLDLWVRKGVPGHKFPLPIIPGCDGAGVVREVGDGVTHVKPGDRVALAPGIGCGACAVCAKGDDHLCRAYGILGETRDGTCADVVALPARNLLPMPAHLSFEEAAAVPLTFLTAWHMVVERCRVRAGDDVLVLAAGSGVSVAAIQILKLHGCRVIAAASSAEKLARARALGADVGVDSASDDVAARVRELTGKAGVDYVVDHVGEATIGTSLRLLKKGGGVVTCGATSGSKLEADLKLIFFKSLSILGSTMGSLGELHRVWSLVGRGALKPVLDETYPLSRLADAHARLESRRAFGKVIVTPGS
ncbi:MAG TPA: zinc-binding dehydrogenase [Planctomycetota bacterium]|nr:zinc-binding dehydrogenase [Planctomycetota bacterium]